MSFLDLPVNDSAAYHEQVEVCRQAAQELALLNSTTTQNQKVYKTKNLQKNSCSIKIFLVFHAQGF